jgi:DNA-binding response OmpR family regulator/predicted ATPase
VQGERAGLTLTSRERALLAYLAAHPSRDISRDELLAEVWGYSDQVVTRAIDITVRRLREKIEHDPARPVHLLTVFGTGYRFEPLREEVVSSTPTGGRRWLVLGERRVDLDVGRVHSADGEPVALTSSERTVLEVLAERSGGVVETEEIVRALWGPGVQRARPLHSLLYRLRKKLEPDPDEPRYLLTVRGSGMRLMLDTGPSGHTVGTLVQVRLAPEEALWEPEPFRALVAELEQSSRAAGGVPTGDGWEHLFTDPQAARRWARALLVRHSRLAVALHCGPLVWWTEPSTGRTVCAGPAVLRSRELVAQAEPGTLLDEQGSEPAVPEQFVGRERELSLLGRYLSRPGLVTLAGEGGMGKTALAERAAASFGGPVVWCELVDATSRMELVRQLARALDLRLLPARPEAQVGQALAGRGEILVVLDRFEAPSELIGTWLEAAPEARFLATSSRPLGLGGERALEVGPLSRSEAEQLLASRAQQRGQGNQPELQTLGETLHGVPLALELAAARLGTQSPEEVLQQLEQTLLRRRKAPHELPVSLLETLQAALDWSWEQLDPPSRSVLAQLSVFHGAFDAAAVEAVCVSPGPFVLDVLGALMDRSLVWARGPRMGLLDPVRDFARHKLDEPRQPELRHGRWYARLAQRLRSLGRQAELAAEYDNLAAAARAATARGDGPVAVDCALGAAGVLRIRGPFDAGVELLQPLMALELPWDLQRLVVRSLSDVLRSGCRVQEGVEHAQRWLLRARAEGDDGIVCALLSDLGLHELERGRPEAGWLHMEEALGLARDKDLSSYLGMALGNAAMIQLRLGNYELAERFFRESAAREGRSQAVSLGNLGALLAELGRNEEAHTCCMEALPRAQQDGDVRMEAYLRSTLALIAYNRGQPELALDFTRRSRELHRQVGSRRSEGLMASREGELLGRLGRVEEGLACCEVAVRLHQQLGLRTAEADSLYDMGCLLALAGRTAQAEQVLSQSMALARETNQVLLEGAALAELAMLHPRRDEARSQALRAVELASSVGTPSLLGTAWQAMAATASGPQEALEYLERAEQAYAERDPMQVGLIRCERARYLLALGRPQEARAQAESVRPLLPTGAPVERALARLLEALGEPDIL